jgi:hypothetical protein
MILLRGVKRRGMRHGLQLHKTSLERGVGMSGCQEARLRSRVRLGSQYLALLTRKGKKSGGVSISDTNPSPLQAPSRNLYGFYLIRHSKLLPLTLDSASRTVGGTCADILAQHIRTREHSKICVTPDSLWRGSRSRRPVSILKNKIMLVYSFYFGLAYKLTLCSNENKN